jgi:DNA-directed RNA polymerase subunit RPC12/RpoP
MTVKCNKCGKDIETIEKKTVYYCEECMEKLRKEQPRL